jgi:ATP-dependent protease Clp ATPase subunit
VSHLREAARRIVRRGRPPFQCSACGCPRTEARRLLAGPGVYLCEPCIRDAFARLTEPALEAEAAGLRGPCSFCGGTHAPALLTHGAAPLVVCAACVRLMEDILSEDDDRRRAAT